MAPFGYEPPEEGAFRDQINEIVKLYKILKDSELVKLWLKLGNLHKLAHRNSLAHEMRNEIAERRRCYVN
jgi:hypothetical protein